MFHHLPPHSYLNHHLLLTAISKTAIRVVIAVSFAYLIVRATAIVRVTLVSIPYRYLTPHHLPLHLNKIATIIAFITVELSFEC